MNCPSDIDGNYLLKFIDKLSERFKISNEISGQFLLKSTLKHFQIFCSYAFLPHCHFLPKSIYFVSIRYDVFLPALHATVQEVQLMKYIGKLCKL